MFVSKKLRFFVYTLLADTKDAFEKVQVGKDQEKAQSEKDSHSKKPRWEKTKLTIRYLYHENTPQAKLAAIFQIGGHSVT